MISAFAVLEKWIRSGQIAEARRYLLAHRRELRKSAAAHLDILAAFYRRVGLPEESLRLLVARVRPAGRQKIWARTGERIEYAAALTACGAASEALSLLRSIAPAESPEVHLHRAYALFKEWNYADAIPELQAYVKSPKIDLYFRRVGEINLAAALVYERRPEAEALLNELISNATREGSLRILANARELNTQACLHRREWFEAEASIEEARRLLRDEGAGDALYIEKWHAILHLRQGQKSREAQARLTAVQLKAQTRGDWESVRDTERELALASRDEERLQRLYLGTPYPAYRARLEADLRERSISMKFESTYRWTLGSGPLGTPLDLTKTASVSKDKVTLRLLRALTRDLYAPPNLVALHAQLHPDRYFNIHSSPGLLHQSVVRARRWLAKHSPGLDIAALGGGRYALRARRGSHEILVGEAEKAAFPTAPFGIRDYMRFAQLRRRSAQRRLGEAVAQRLLQTEGDGKKLRYRAV